MIPLLAALLLALSQEKRLPPPGIDLPPAEDAAIAAGIEELGKALSTIRHPRVDDVRVIHEALHGARQHREFMDPKDAGAAKDLIKLGLERAKALAAGSAPWTTQSGLVPLAYRSRLDDSLQPYGLVIPADWNPGETRKRRLDLWLHGRDEKLTQLRFLHQRTRQAGEFTPPGAIVLHLYGRFCNGFKFGGEVDALEALEDVKKRYAIDEDRILLRGFSMGGAGAWFLGTHHAGLWTAVAPGAGFVETERYANVAKDPVPPTPWQRTLWSWTNATDYALNLFNTPVIAYSGELDKQKAAADFMAEAMKKEGLDLVHLIGPKTEHKYEPETKKELNRRIDEIAERGRDPNPAELRWVTHTLRYPGLKWLRLEGLERHWEQARVVAKRDGASLRIETRNVSALQLTPKPAPSKVVLDGTELPWAAAYRKVDGTWSAGQLEGLRKRPGLQGPIDDAFMDRFLVVLPTGRPLSEASGAWTARESKRAVEAWRSFFRGEARVKNDSAVEAADWADSNLILWGDPSSNALLAKILPQLPLTWTATELKLADKTFDVATQVPVLIYPNPLNPARYVVLNSGFTFQSAMAASNSRHVAMLPDWAVLDRARGGTVAADFFDETWKPR